MDTPPLDDPPIALEERLSRFSGRPQQTLQNSKRKIKPFTSPTPSTTNATTTANVPDRPL